MGRPRRPSRWYRWRETPRATDVSKLTRYKPNPGYECRICGYITWNQGLIAIHMLKKHPIEAYLVSKKENNTEASAVASMIRAMLRKDPKIIKRNFRITRGKDGVIVVKCKVCGLTMYYSRPLIIVPLMLHLWLHERNP
jgi:rubrerythrin